MNILLLNLTKMVGDTGGVAKVACAFANEMHRRDHKVSLVYSDVKTGDFFFPIDKSISCTDLRHFNGETITYPLSLKIKRELYRMFDKQKAFTVNAAFEEKYLLKNLQIVLKQIHPDIIVSFNSAGSKLLLCDLQTKIPVITMSHGDILDVFERYPKAEITALEKSAVCQVLVPSYERILKEHLPKAHVVVIGNVVPQYDIQADLSSQKETYKILFVGRLAKNHKRPHLLIEAFAKLSGEFPNWRVELWGAEHGKVYYKELELLINKYHLENKVFLRGTTDNVKSVLSKGDVLAFPSAFEGFSLALTEAMSIGLPVVGYKNCSGLNELIQDGVSGFLCDDGVDDFADKLKTLMENQELRVQMGQAARESMKPYNAKKIWDTWEILLRKVLEDYD